MRSLKLLCWVADWLPEEDNNDDAKKLLALAWLAGQQRGGHKGKSQRAKLLAKENSETLPRALGMMLCVGILVCSSIAEGHSAREHTKSREGNR